MKNNKFISKIKECTLIGTEIYAKERRYEVDMIIPSLIDYLDNLYINWLGFEKNPKGMWLLLIQQWRPSPAYHMFASMAIEITQIPVPEAPVERFFSQFEKILTPQRHRLAESSIEALSIIKMNYLFGEELKRNIKFSKLEKALRKVTKAM